MITELSGLFGRSSWTTLLLAAAVLSGGLSSCKNTPTEPVPLDPPEIAQPKPSKRTPVPSSNDNIQVGDKLEIFVSEDPTFNGVYVVRENGDIILPRLGRIVVKNGSVPAAEKKIKSLLENSQIRSASVIVDRVARAPVEVEAAEEDSGPQALPKMLAYFTGHVKRPGQHWITLPRGQPVGIYEAILISGGLARFANDRKVEVLRKSDQGDTRKMILDLRAVREGEAPDPPLYEGDIVFVPEKRIGL